MIQVNTDLPITIDRAIDLACHEGYPGHHVYNALLEQHLVRDRGWVEFSVYPLFSPQSLIAEGTANFGIEVAFPGRGADGVRARHALSARRPRSRDGGTLRGGAAAVDEAELRGQRSRAPVPERRDRSRRRGRPGCRQWAMMPKDRAEQRTRFFDQYRSYVINYNLGQDLVAAYIERAAARRSSGRALAGVRQADLHRHVLPSGLR